MARLRTPFLILAIILSFIVLLLETGTALPFVLSSSSLSVDSFQLSSDVRATAKQEQGAIDQLSKQPHPPGLGIPDMALLDSIVLFTAALMGVALILPERIQGRVQGIATLIFSLLLIIVAIVLILLAIGSLILMISLLLAVPFGTIAYLIIYAGFNRTGADIMLSLLMLLKFGFALSLFFAQQRFLQSKGLVLLVLTSLLCNVIVSFLLGIVPGFLVSITDAIAAIIVAIIAVIWGIFLLIGSIVSIIKILRIDRSLPTINAVTE